MAQDEPQRLLFRCRMAEAAERWDDMADSVVDLISYYCQNDLQLGPIERNFLTASFKNRVGSFRNSLRCLSSMISMMKDDTVTPAPIDDREERLAQLAEYYTSVLSDLEGVCNRCLDLVVHIRPNLKSLVESNNTEGITQNIAELEAKGKDEIEAEVYFAKLAADYFRYLAEFDDANAKEKSHLYYKYALDVARTLAPSHPSRLGVALNFSVFLFEIQHSIEKARMLAKEAFDEALDNLDGGEVEYKDSTLILQLLRDNSVLWSTVE